MRTYLRRRSWRIYIAILLGSLALRAIWALLVPVIPVSDCRAYDVFAQNLASSNTYGWAPDSPSAYWPVGTSFIYSIFYRLFSHSYGPIVIFNILIGTGTVFLSVLLAQRWHNTRIALITGILLALWPVHIEFTTLLASELPFTFFVLLAVYLWPHSNEKKLLSWRLISSAFATAIACYIRPTALLLPVVLFVTDLARTRKALPNLLKLSVAFLVMIVLILPWSIRNIGLFDRFALISTNGGSNLWMGNNPETKGGYMPRPSKPDWLNEAEFDAELKDEAVAYIISEPLDFLKRTAIKTVRLHERETIGIVWNEKGLEERGLPQLTMPMKVLSTAYWLTLLLIACLGITFMLYRQGLLYLIGHPGFWIWAYFTAIYAVFVYGDRYHFPSTPFIGILAAVFVDFLLSKVCNRKDKTAGMHATCRGDIYG